MYKSIVLIGAFLFSAITVQAGPIPGGSWCYNPQNEPFWGAATSGCCNGWMGNDRRCHDIPDCQAFYSCCINKWNSGNHLTDTCT
ncbi:hypothetical protein BGX26_009238 [Mortierella sp. AD094]|nr:hypothetical protein BGX26_009238 [Mortierella sp. AD094]